MSQSRNPSSLTPSSPLAAIAIMMLCAALLAATTLMAKALGRGIGGEPLPPLVISAGRFAFAWLTLLPIVLWVRPSFAGAAWSLHGARSVFGWAGVSCMFAAATVLPLADATAISFLNPVIAMILAIPLLGEKIGPWRWAASVIALGGAIFLIRPGVEAFQPFALVALAAAFLLGFEVIIIKKLAGGSALAGEPLLRILFINNSIGSVISLGVATMVWVWPSHTQWMLLAMLGTTMVAAQMCFIQAMKRAEASFILPFSYATLIFAVLYDIAIFDVVPPSLSIFGAVMIIAGAVVLAWRERVRTSKS